MKFYLKQINKNPDTCRTYKYGFTLIEIMVATSIFMIIMLVSLSALVISSNVAKQSKALRTSMDNVSFAMESMTRSLRMGTNYYCDNTVTINTSTTKSTPTMQDCNNGASAVLFIPASHINQDTAYLWVARSDGTHTLERAQYNPNTGVIDYLDMMSSNIDIAKLTFIVKGSSLTDNIQPSIYILIKGTVKTSNGQLETFAIQTEVSQRSAE
jgi:type II secretory pathway pseudopilin PulG